LDLLLSKLAKKSTVKRVSVSVQGHVLRVEVNGAAVGSGGGDRGMITEFSHKSRLRLITLLNRLEFEGQDQLPKFMTLTMGDIVHPRVAKKYLRVFLERIRRWAPGASAVWRLEFQARGAPHFHLIWFGLPFLPFPRLQEMWGQVIGQDLPICRIEAIKTRNGVIYYASKYLAKVDSGHGPASGGPSGDGDVDSTLFNYVPYLHADGEAPGDDGRSVGRFWGVFNRSRLPLASEYKAEQVFGDWFRTLTKLAASKWDGIDADSENGFTLFIEDSEHWLGIIEYLLSEERV
jgi:hypothetical protein